MYTYTHYCLVVLFLSKSINSQLLYKINKHFSTSLCMYYVALVPMCSGSFIGHESSESLACMIISSPHNWSHSTNGLSAMKPIQLDTIKLEKRDDIIIPIHLFAEEFVWEGMKCTRVAITVEMEQYSVINLGKILLVFECSNSKFSLKI